LAARYNRPDVDAFLAERTPAELNELLGFDLLEPVGGKIDDERFSLLTAHVAKIEQGPEHFRLAWRPEVKPPTTAEIIEQQLGRQRAQT
jgi:hypothetical protein